MMQSAILLQLDVTANSIEEKEVLKRYGLFGPPATLFFDQQGREMLDARVVGYQDVTQFIQSLTKAGF